MNQDQQPAAAGTSIVEARDLVKSFTMEGGLLRSLVGRGAAREVHAVDRVSFSIRAGEILGLAGESGSGKSTTGMMLSNLISTSSGQIFIDGKDIAKISGRQEAQAFRKDVQIVFQNPYESLNPRFTVLRSVEEPLHLILPGRHNRAERRARAIKALERAGLTPAENFVERFPHQMSGGQLQRVAFARAISVEPRVLIADEPVSMLDVSIRAGILNLLGSLARDLGMGILYISHDISTMAHVCSRVAIMYLGRIVEMGDAQQVLLAPKHPYTKALVAAVPRLSHGTVRQRVALEGAIPSVTNIPSGCQFHPRCPIATDLCQTTIPELSSRDGAQAAACHYA